MTKRCWTVVYFQLLIWFRLIQIHNDGIQIYWLLITWHLYFIYVYWKHLRPQWIICPSSSQCGSFCADSCQSLSRPTDMQRFDLDCFPSSYQSIETVLCQRHRVCIIKRLFIERKRASLMIKGLLLLTDHRVAWWLWFWLGLFFTQF